MNEAKIKLLEELGFACKKKPGLLWMAQYNLLKNFKEENGHCHVPMHYKKDKKLGHWVNNQRQLYRKYKAGLPTSMNESRIELLEELGFAWILGKDWKEKRKEDKMKSKVTTTTESSSSVQGNDEIEEPDEDGIEESPSSDNSVVVFEPSHDADMEDTSPQGLVVSQEITVVHKPTVVVLTDNLAEEAVSKADPVSKTDNVSKADPVSKTDNHTEVPPMDLIRQARPKRKRPSIPEVEVEGRILSHILFSANPGEYDSDNSSYASDSDSPIEGREMNPEDRRAKRIRMPYNTDKHWNKRFEDLVKFKSIHGHCHVPFQYAENKSLSYWVSNQRQKYRKFVKEEDSTLNTERINSLLSLGFKFNARDTYGKDGGKIQEPDAIKGASYGVDLSESALWEIRLQELKEYVAKHGDCVVPAIYPAKR